MDISGFVHEMSGGNNFINVYKYGDGTWDTINRYFKANPGYEKTMLNLHQTLYRIMRDNP